MKNNTIERGRLVIGRASQPDGAPFIDKAHNFRTGRPNASGIVIVPPWRLRRRSGRWRTRRPTTGLFVGRTPTVVDDP